MTKGNWISSGHQYTLGPEAADGNGTKWRRTAPWPIKVNKEMQNGDIQTVQGSRCKIGDDVVIQNRRKKCRARKLNERYVETPMVSMPP
jgi:hypothetical protein